MGSGLEWFPAELPAGSVISKLRVTPPVCTKFSSKPSVEMLRQAAGNRYQTGAREQPRLLNLFICIQKIQVLFQLQVRIHGDEAIPVRGESCPVLGAARHKKARKGGVNQGAECKLLCEEQTSELQLSAER